jgi:hypothetical protein
MKLNNLDDLKREKLRLKFEGETKLLVLKHDLDIVKKELKPLALLNKASTIVVPDSIRHSSLLNSAINYVARTVFKKDEVVVSQASDTGKGNQVRNVALTVLETTATYLLTKYIRRKL